MKTSLILLIIIHGIIHLFGYFKAFGIVEFDAISHSISKPFGLIWLLAFILFTLAAVLMPFGFKYWWAIGMIAIIISQFLIFNYWSDAKFGTIVNLLLLGVTITAYSTFQFENNVCKERKRLLENAKDITPEIIEEKTILDLPLVVRKWLLYSGVIGKKPVSNVYLTQQLQLKMKEDQRAWMTATADQYFTVQPPAFNWKISMQMNPVINVIGRDKFENGKGEMSIKMLGLISVANAKNNAKINEASLQRYLAEIIWFPTAALSPYITWEPIDDQSARATMKYKGTEGSGIFYFGENGAFSKFTAMRFKDVKDKEPKLWTVNATKNGERNGIKIPVECEAKWQLENQEWTWLKLKITDIEYNLKEMRATNGG